MPAERQHAADDPFQELLRAVEVCDAARCHAMLDSGVDVNTTTSAGCTPLMFAVMPSEFGDPCAPRAVLSLVQTLLKRGADPRMVDRSGMTAADYARQLLDPSWKDKFGQPAVVHWDSADKAVIGEIIELLDSPG